MWLVVLWAVSAFGTLSRQGRPGATNLRLSEPYEAMMLSRQEEEQERRATLENDLKVLEQQRGTTFHQHAVAEASIETGRFTAVNAAHVVGSQPAVRYPAASAAHQTELPPEPPLGFSVNSLEPSAVSMSFPAVEQLGGAESAPSAPPDVQHPAPPSSSEQTNE
jgi:hypothetical protein